MVHAEVASSSPLAERRAARFDRILDAAMQLLAEDGLEGLTLKRLAERLGYAVGALYRYFDSKDELLVELERRVAAEFREALGLAATRAGERAEERVASPTVASLAAIRAVVLGYADLARSAPAQFRLASLMLADPRELLREEHGRRVMESLAPLLGDVRDLFEIAAERGALAEGDAVERTLTLWGGLHGVLQLTKLARFEPERMDGRRRVEHLLESLLAGWGARTAEVAATKDLEGDGR